MMFQQARETIVRTSIALADRGYLAGTGGNIALRADQDHFLLTPSGTDYYEMGAEDICVMRLSDHKKVEGEATPSVEAGLHANVLNARPDCNASIHTHQPIASAYTLLAASLEVKDETLIAMLGRTVPCVSYAPSGTGWLARGVGKAFDNKTHACLMRNHGVLCVGKDEQQGIERVAALEAACAAWFQEHLNRTSQVPAATAVLIEQTLRSVAGPQNQEPSA